MTRVLLIVGLLTIGFSGAANAEGSTHHKSISELIHRYSARYHVPEKLVRRVVARESRFNAKARRGECLGLMQIKLRTARGLGYRGNSAGLLDPDTNLRYGVAYLANALRVAGGDRDRAAELYRRGYHREAARKGIKLEMIAAR